MLKNITRILPFLIVTLLSIGGVELFYGVAENYLTLPPKKVAKGGDAVSPANTGSKKLQQHTNYQVIVERNLFQSYLEEEKPVEEEKTNPLEGLESTSLDLVLLGTITGQDDRSRAIILDKSGKKQDLYYRGDFVQNAEIKEILRGKVILEYQGRDEVLDMSEAASVAPKQSTPAAVSPAQPRRRVISRPAASQTRVRSTSGGAQRRMPAPLRERFGEELDEEFEEPEEVEEELDPDAQEIPPSEQELGEDEERNRQLGQPVEGDGQQ